MRKVPTATLVAKCRRAAKAVARTSDVTHGLALDAEAVRAGYASWSELLAAHQVRAQAPSVDGDAAGDTDHAARDYDAWFRGQVQASIDDPRPNVSDEAAREASRLARVRVSERHAAALTLDPVLPKRFYDTPNEDRSTLELDQWWDVPYAVTQPDGALDVRCLDGGAWDRPTFYGRAPDMAAAVKLAAEKLAKWRGFRSAPVASMTEDGLYEAVLMPQRPDDDPETISEPMTGEELKKWMDTRKAAGRAGG